MLTTGSHGGGFTGTQFGGFEGPALDKGRAGADQKEKKAWEDTGLGVPETEIFDLFQRFRHFMLGWLTSHPATCNEIMESIVKVILCIQLGILSHAC